MNHKRQKKITIKTVFILLALAALIYLIKISVDEYQRQTEATGIVICDDGECIKTLHIHADLELDLCGQSPVLPREVGPLSGLHTHKESNYLHFHDKVKLDPKTREQLYDKRLSLQEIIDVFELDPQTYCGTDAVSIRAIVNGVEKQLDYNWQDGDQILLIYEAT